MQITRVTFEKFEPALLQFLELDGIMQEEVCCPITRFQVEVAELPSPNERHEAD